MICFSKNPSMDGLGERDGKRRRKNMKEERLGTNRCDDGDDGTVS
jgi:hypothetical protein